MTNILLTMNAVVAPGGTVQIVQRPLVVPLRPLRLRVLSTGAFDILDVKVGNRSQFKSSDAIPAEFFVRRRTEHVEAIARWIEASRGYGSLADAIREGAWKTDGYQDEEDSIAFPCETIQSAMDFVMVARNRDLDREGVFSAVWTCEEVIPSPKHLSAKEMVRRMQAAAEAVAPRTATEKPPAPIPTARALPPRAEAISDASGVGWDPYGDD